MMHLKARAHSAPPVITTATIDAHPTTPWSIIWARGAAAREPVQRMLARSDAPEKLSPSVRADRPQFFAFLDPMLIFAPSATAIAVWCARRIAPA
jgi:hypothetical protein